VTWDIVHEGELYNVLKLWPQATALAQGTSETTTDPQICIWINEYGKSRVFGTTIGHHNSTMSDPVYLDLVTRGLLWATGRLGRD
ncbi:MAG: ThuA domain-containing protein, partial [Verrucomicrobiales bacterium]